MGEYAEDALEQTLEEELGYMYPDDEDDVDDYKY